MVENQLRKMKNIRCRIELILFWLLVVCYCGRLYAQENDTTEVNKTRLCLIGGLLAGTVVTVHLYQQAAWWQGEHTPFRFENDWDYALNIDKWGHAFGAYVAANVGQSALRWSNVPEQKSLVYGCLLGLSYQLYVEMEDGFHKEYGFSPGDAFSDLIGASIPLAQSTFPVLQNFALEWSYYPSSGYLNALKTERFKVFIDDYEGQIYWLRLDPHFLLNDQMAHALPKWLGVVFGIGVHNLDGSGGGTRAYYLAADYRLSSMDFFTGNDFVRALFSALDYIHLPSPAIALEDGKVKVGIFYTYHVKVTL
jgi:hypothetical protein